MTQPRAAPDLDEAPEASLRQLAPGMDEWLFRQARHHVPRISLRRSQPERLSIAMTISTISTM